MDPRDRHHEHIIPSAEEAPTPRVGTVLPTSSPLGTDGAALPPPDSAEKPATGTEAASLPTEDVPLSPRTEVRDVPGGTVVVVVMERPDGKPATLGPEGLRRLTEAVRAAVVRCEREGHLAVVLTGVGTTFLAGADLDLVTRHADSISARELGRMGHVLVEEIMDAPVPVVALVNGTALGGGLEVALACRARLAVDDVRMLGLPESHLGLVAGWGGSFLLPHLIGPAAATTVLLENPLRNNRLLRAADALELGVVDAVAHARRDADGETWPAEELGALLADPPRDSVPVRYAPEGADEAELQEAWERVAEAEPLVERAERGGRAAPRRAFELLTAARTSSRTEAFAAEDEALHELVPTPQLRNTIHSMAILRAHRPGRAASQVRSVGVIGGGLMASQLAVLLAGRLQVPVVLREVDAERAERTRALVAAEIGKLGLDGGAAEALGGLLTATTELADLADADLVIEAVFEELSVKQQVFGEVEQLLRGDAVLATNTSSLSVTAMGSVLQHPERLVGIHFFNPVARMPLVEIVRTPSTSPEALEAARTLAWAVGKTTIEVADAPGFVVNRVLIRLLAEALNSMERGTPPAVVDSALEPIGLPMGPLHLLQLVGPAVANHVLHELHNRLGDRYPLSPGLDAVVAEGASFLTGPPSATTPLDASVGRFFGAASASTVSPGSDDGGRVPSSPPVAGGARQYGPDDEASLLRRVQLALADEVHRMIDEGVAARDSIDVGMITGAGWPLHRGGITRYLDEAGASEETGGLFHP
nr:3-hydroxyacyl-CoA dehydrogenase [Actinomycetales bacterium]